MSKSIGWNVSKVVDLSAPGPRSLVSPRRSRFVADDGTVLEVRDLLFVGADLDHHRSFDARMLLPGGVRARRVKVQLDLYHFNGNVGELVLRVRGAGRSGGLDAGSWHAVAHSLLDAVYGSEPAAARVSELTDDASDDEAAA